MSASEDEDEVSCEGPSPIEASQVDVLEEPQSFQSYSGGVRPKIRKQCASVVSSIPFPNKSRSTEHEKKINGFGCSTSGNKTKSEEIHKKMAVGLPNYLNYSGSSSENDDECCIYMLKGYSGMDTSPIGRLHIHDDQEPRRASSPEMDFLEMDFDPGQSNGHEYSDDSDCCDMEQSESRPSSMSCELASNKVDEPETEPTNSATGTEVKNEVPSLVKLAEQASCSTSSKSENPPVKGCAEKCAAIPSVGLSPLRVVGDSVLTTNSVPSSQIEEVEMDPYATAMIWSESEAEIKQTNAGSPAKGVAAVINTLVSFGLDSRKETVYTLLDNVIKMDDFPLPKYLFMKSVCCSSHEDIMKAVCQISRGKLTSRFFPTFPRRQLALCAWLLYWVHKGAVPILTLNQKRGTQGGHHDGGWQHRMVSGVNSREIYLTDPISRVAEATIVDHLSNPSTLLVPRDDIVARWRPETDLIPLMTHPNQSWKTCNVLGQIVNIVRDEMRGRKANDVQFVSIPTRLTCGVTLIMSTDNPNTKDLDKASELPLAPTFEGQK